MAAWAGGAASGVVRTSMPADLGGVGRSHNRALPAQRSDHSTEREECTRDSGWRPPVTLQRRRETHGDDWDDHAGISRLCRADDPDDRVIKAEGQHRGGECKVSEAGEI